MGQICARRLTGVAQAEEKQRLREAVLQAAERRAAATAAAAGEASATDVASRGFVGNQGKGYGSTAASSSSRTASVAIAAQSAAAKAAASRAEAAASARRAVEEFQLSLQNGQFVLGRELKRFAVGSATDGSRRSCLNHDDFAQSYWDAGHRMDHPAGSFRHDFSFWAFSDAQPGTQRIVVGIAGGHVSAGPLRCLANCSCAGEAGWHTPAMAQHGYTPQHSFWGFDAPQIGTVRVAVMVSAGAMTQSCFLCCPQEQSEVDVLGFRQEFVFWAYPDFDQRFKRDKNIVSLRLTRHVGVIPAGGDLAQERMTVDGAKAKCMQIPGCRGFTFAIGSEDAHGKVEVFFKDRWQLGANPGWMSYRCIQTGEFDADDAAAAAAEGRRPPEYEPARKSMCISGELLGRCEVQTVSRVLQTRWSCLEERFEELAVASARRAFPDAWTAGGSGTGGVFVELLHDDAAPRVEIVGMLRKLRSKRACDMLQDWRVTLLPSVLRFLAESADGVEVAAAALLLLGYASWRLFDHAICPVMARRCFDRCLLVLKLDDALPQGLSSSAIDPRDNLREWLARYVEMHKERGFISAFLEPNRLYWRRLCGGGSVQEADVDAHAANVYAALVERCLGVRCSIPVAWDDSFAVHGIAEFLRAPFLQGALRAMQRLENFGQSYAKLIRHREEADGNPAAVPLGGVRFIFAGARSPDEIAAQAMWPAEEMRTEREALRPYLERFADFFRLDFFLESACNAALADNQGGGSRCLAEALRLLIDQDTSFSVPKAHHELGVDGDEQWPSDDEALCRKVLWDFDEHSFPKFDAAAAERLFDFVGGILQTSSVDI